MRFQNIKRQKQLFIFSQNIWYLTIYSTIQLDISGIYVFTQLKYIMWTFKLLLILSIAWPKKIIQTNNTIYYFIFPFFTHENKFLRNLLQIFFINQFIWFASVRSSTILLFPKMMCIFYFLISSIFEIFFQQYNYLLNIRMSKNFAWRK